MKARVQWAGEALFLGESGSGHAVVMDAIHPMPVVVISVCDRWRCC